MRTALSCAPGHVKASHLGGLARTALIVLGAIASGSMTRGAVADEPSLDGAWNMTAVTESFVVQQWSAPCGPAPVSGTMVPAGRATIRSDRGELVVASERRILRTDACLDTMPTLTRETHSHDARSWRTRCSTPRSDPRHAVVNTAFFVAPGDDSISMAETGRYEFTINEGHCVADVKRGALLTRVVAGPGAPFGAPSAAPLAREKPNPASLSSADCSTHGEPARLEVRPSRKLLRLGETFGFGGVVVDANGCATGTPIQWTIGPIVFHDGKTHAARPTIDGAGRLTAPEDDFSDAAFDVVATAAGREARASVEATSSANYESLLAQSGLGPNGEQDEPSVAVLATSSIGASRAKAEDGATQRRIIFVSVTGCLALLLGIVAIIGARRARSATRAERAAHERHIEKMREYEGQKNEREQLHAEHVRAHNQSVAIAQQQAAAAAARGIASGPSFCPSCRREFPGGGGFCPFDANRLVPIAGHEDLLAGPAGGVCPTCKRGFNPGVRVCPHDGEELVPPSLAEVRPVAIPRGKICPACGDRFDGAAAFCGKDGTQLVLLN